jgi:hypothetical protein
LVREHVFSDAPFLNMVSVPDHLRPAFDGLHLAGVLASAELAETAIVRPTTASDNANIVLIRPGFFKAAPFSL